VLIYDGDCPFCSVAASAIRRVEDVAAVPWENDAAQRFLAAQFGETPFALALADAGEETVYLGRSAARELAERAGMPALVRNLVDGNYESLADAVQTVSGSDQEVDLYHGTTAFTEAAREAHPALADTARGEPATVE
jgi:predicted DCC family thiol-disulfide oxidoreductase YuxK